MSDSDKDGSGKEELNEADLAREIEGKCYKAFVAFDPDGNGSQVKSDQIKQILEHIDIKMGDQEMYKIISEIDPDNTGYIRFSLFKQKLVAREVERLIGSDESELLDAFVAMGGEPDGEGCVDAKKLIATIKDEF